MSQKPSPGNSKSEPAKTEADAVAIESGTQSYRHGPLRRVFGHAVRWTTLLTLLLVLVFVAFSGWLLATQSGLQTSLGWADKALPALQLDGISGSWYGGVHLRRLSWQEGEDSAKIAVDELSMHWDMARLLQGRMVIDGLRVENIDLQLPEPAAPQANKTPAEIVLPKVLIPVFVQIVNVELAAVQVRRGSAGLLTGTLTLPELSWQGTTLNWRELLIQLAVPSANSGGVTTGTTTDSAARDMALQLSSEGELGLRDDYPLDLTLAVQRYEVPGLESINQQLSTLFQGDVQLPAAFTLMATGSVAELQVDAVLSPELPLALSSQFKLLTPNLPFSLTLKQSEALQINAASQGLRIAQTELAITGDLQRQSALLRSQVGGLNVADKALADARVVAEVSLAWPQLTLSSLRLDHPDGNLSAHCDMQLSPLQGECSGDLTQLRWPFAADKPDLTLASSFTLAADMESESTGPALVVTVPHVDGKWQQQVLSGKAKLLMMPSGRWQIPNLVLAFGENTLQAKGWLPDFKTQPDSGVAASGPVSETEKRALEVTASLTDLAVLPGEFSGQIDADFVVAGTLAQPLVNGRVVASDLTWPGGQLAHIELTAPVVSNKAPSQIVWQAKGLSLAGTDVKTLKGELRGNLSAHQLNLQLAGLQTAASWIPEATIACKGGLQNSPQGWKGSCNQLAGQVALPDRSIEDFHLQQPLQVAWTQADNALVVEPLCLNVGPMQLCNTTQLLLGPKQQTAMLKLTGLPVTWLLPALPQLQYSGQIDGQLSLESLSPMAMSASLSAKDTRMEWQPAGPTDERIPPIVFQQLAVDAKLTVEKVELTLTGNAPGMVNLNGQLAIADPLSSRQLSGQVAMDVEDFSPFAALIEPVSALSGASTLQANLAGTLYQPEISGKWHIAGSNVQTDYIDETVKSFQFDVDFAGQSLSYNGAFTMAKGEGNVSGQGVWNSMTDWEFQNSLKVAALGVKLPQWGSAVVDVDLALNAAPEQLQIQGSGKVREANIQVDSLPPSRASVSPDANVIGRPEEHQAWSQVIDVSLDLGDKFHFTGFGADLWLNGAINYQQISNEQSHAKGKVVVSRGRYRAYGQRLNVRKGELIFNGPLDNPLLQMEVVRDTSSTQVAGIRLTGPLQQPDTELFSEPALSQTDTAYFLVSGQTRGQASNAEASSAEALLAMGVGKFGAGKLAEQLGIDDFQIGATQTDNGAEAQVSGYVNPRLFVRYSAGLDHNANTLTLQYRLSSRLMLESVTGFNRALDLLYTFTRD